MKECKADKVSPCIMPRRDIEKELSDAVETGWIYRKLHDKILLVYRVDPDNFIMNIGNPKEFIYANPTKVNRAKQQIFYGYEDDI